jgi:hypothetical protein
MVQLMLLLFLHPLLQVVWTTLTVGSSLTVALAVPDQAEKIYAVVGASAVCVVCYVIPVYIQLQMYRKSKQQQKLQVRTLAGQQLVWWCCCCLTSLQRYDQQASSMQPTRISAKLFWPSSFCSSMLVVLSCDSICQPANRHPCYTNHRA